MLFVIICNLLLFLSLQGIGGSRQYYIGKSSLKEYALKGSECDIDKNWFSIIFDRLTEKWLETTKKTTQKTTQKIMSLIKENPNMTIKELASTIGITEDGIKYHIANLKKKGLLKRVGPDKGGHWRVVEDDK